MKERIFRILNCSGTRRKGDGFGLFIMALIILNCLSIVLETEKAIYIPYATYFYIFEVFSIIIFSVEYLLRIWTCTLDPAYSHPVRGRLAFIFSPMALVDFMAIAPFFLTFMVTDLRFLRALRLFRVFRIFKLVRYSRAMATFGRIAVSKREELLITAVMGLTLVFIASSFIYHFENEAQPEAFSSIPHAMWWSVVTLTTVGYGDVVPITIEGKIFASLVAVSGIAMFALPAGILGSAFVLEEVIGTNKGFRMHNHFILCGMGKLGIQVLRQLKRLGKEVAVVENNTENSYLPEVREMGFPIILGDIRSELTLADAHVGDAQCLIALSDNDLANLEAALNARAAKKDIHIVMRLLDQTLAGKIQTGFGIESAFSPSTLAAPAFAMAAVDPCVVGSFYVGDDLMLNLEISVTPGSRLDGLTTTDLEKEGHVSILAHTSAATEERRLHISDSFVMAAGDKLVLNTTPALREKLHEMNRAER